VPRYSYKCNLCGAIDEIFHLMSESVTNCEHCNAADSLERIPALFSVSESKLAREKSTAKERVDTYISETRKALDEHQQESRKDYEP
jgi:putative FmdB family regulatory protein